MAVITRRHLRKSPYAKNVIKELVSNVKKDNDIEIVAPSEGRGQGLYQLKGVMTTVTESLATVEKGLQSIRRSLAGTRSEEKKKEEEEKEERGEKEENEEEEEEKEEEEKEERFDNTGLITHSKSSILQQDTSSIHLDEAPQGPTDISTSTTPPPTVDQDLMLQTWCVDVLTSLSHGVTIKELCDLLYLTYPQAKIMLKSSTVLATKLNSFIRRASSTDPSSCPIARELAKEHPKRLLYRYDPQLDLKKQPNVINSALAEPINSTSIERKKPLDVTVKHEQKQEDGKQDKDAITSQMNSPRDILSSTNDDALPTTPPSTGDVAQSSPHYQLRKTIKKTEHAYVAPVRRQSKVRATTPHQNTSSSPVFNPYYDSYTYLPIGQDHLQTFWHDEFMLEDVKSPEDMCLEDLDMMWCET